MQHVALQVKLDHGLHPVERLNSPLAFGIAHFDRGDIGGKFNHFDWFALGVKNRVVGGL